jgi:acyl dehydratase
VTGATTKRTTATVTWPVTSAEQLLTAELVDSLITLGGYPHPLFHPSPEQRAQGTLPPLMGQGVLLLAGGMAERTGALDDVIAMVGLSDVRFQTMVHAGSRIRLVMDLVSTQTTRSGKRRNALSWLVLDEQDRAVLKATAHMLLHPAQEPG